MTSYKEALEKIFANIQILDIEEKPLLEAIGQVSSEDIYSDFDLPLKDQSGPDGYAVISADVENASYDNPVTLQITETVRAGYLAKGSVEHGTAIRIMTGSVLPDGADCIIRFEDTDEPANKCGPNKDNPTTVKIYKPGTLCMGITKSGGSVKKGALVLSKGTVIGPNQISALAFIGKAKVKVIRRPIIAIISTGDELINLDETLMPGKVYNCNAMAIAALVSHYGGIPKILGIANDNEKSVLAKINKGITMDAIITSGGVSQGDFDVIRNVIAKIGELAFAKINLAPGAAVSFGKINKSIDGEKIKSIPIFALSGPPAGCLINCETLVRPALLKMLGKENTEHPIIETIAKDSVSTKRAIDFARWTRLEKVDDRYYVEMNTADKIGVLAAFASANSLTIIPKETIVNNGDKITVMPLNWF